MKANKMKQCIGKTIAKFAINIAKIEANSTCPYLSYQPKKPEMVKKMRKF